MFKHKWETIPNEAVKRILWSCITGSARKEIELFCPTRLAFKEYETGIFFTELLNRLSQEKYKEGQEQEYLAREQERDNHPREILY